MELRPMFETGTIKFAVPSIQTKKLETKVIADPTGAIPNGIYKVIHWEKIRQLFTIGLSAGFAIAASSLISLYATVWETSWIGFILPIAVLLLSFFKFGMTLQERSYTNKAVLKYREDLKIGLTSTPPFIAKLYVQLHRKQIKHNWITFILMFYGGIATLLLWWLKDVSWWIFHFDQWIHSLFSNPSVMTWVFTATLISVTALHIVLSIQRKRRILEINAYFGENLMPESELTVIKDSKNKQYRRLFLVSLLITLIIPVVVKMALKIFRRK